MTLLFLRMRLLYIKGADNNFSGKQNTAPSSMSPAEIKTCFQKLFSSFFAIRTSFDGPIVPNKLKKQSYSVFLAYLY